MNPTLSWQPPPVTKCGECPNKRVSIRYEMAYCDVASDAYEVVKKNKDGITPTCPMYQQQNKEVK